MNWKKPLYWMDRILAIYILIRGVHSVLAGFEVFPALPPSPFLFAATCWFTYRFLWENSPYAASNPPSPKGESNV